MVLFTRCQCGPCEILISYEATEGKPSPIIPALCEDCAQAHCSSAGNSGCRVDWGAGPAFTNPQPKKPAPEPVLIPAPQITVEALGEALRKQADLYRDLDDPKMRHSIPIPMGDVGALLEGRLEGVELRYPAECHYMTTWERVVYWLEVDRTRATLIALGLLLASALGFLLWWER
jgi:hypothetical protein